MIRVGFFGANGRMGQALLNTIWSVEGLTVKAALVRAGHGLEHKPIEQARQKGVELYYSSDIKNAMDQCDVMIDFTLPHATAEHLKIANTMAMPMVIGTTGLDESHHKLMEALAHKCPVVYSTNMSLGITLLNTLVEQAAKSLGADFDCDVTEMHHKYKKDLPSGTAITLAEHVARGRGYNLKDWATLRLNEAKLQGFKIDHHHKPGEIGLSAKRGGGVYGDHDVIFASEEETLTLSHRALNRDVFAKGALKAASWVTSQSPGLYSLKDVIATHM